MTTLFDRRCKLLVGQPPKADVYTLQTVNRLEISGLRIGFKIIKDSQPQPNNVEISIYNLSASSRAALEEKGCRILLLAGYADQISQIASADVRIAQSQKLGVDWVTKIEAGDGERAIKFARVKESWAPGTPVSEIISKTVSALMLDPGNALAKAKQISAQYSSGYVQNAKASDELTTLLEPHGYEWSVQDGRIEVLKKNEALPETAPLLSPDTGLIGAPEMGTPAKAGEKPVLKVRSLLQPRIRPGQRFQLRSASRNGVFLAKKVTHAGDTFGNDWYTDIEATAT
jgi:hypothetical protein